jgi:hypothetical protein
MFHLFARKSQFLPKSSKQDCSNLFLRSDISVVQDFLLVSFRWTKTSQFGQVLQVPLVSIPGSPLCPVKAYLNMVELVPAASSSLMFVLPGPKRPRPISYAVFHAIFRSLVNLTGRNSSVYSSHSFRRGGASFALQLGVPQHVIQSQGLWKSDAYLGYLDVSLDLRLQLARSVSSSLSGGYHA